MAQENIVGNHGDLNRGNKESKFQRKLTVIKAVQDTVNSWQSLLFRGIVLLFVIAVEVTLFVALFNRKELNGPMATALIIVAVLPILVMRAFDLTALNLTKEGFASTMVQNSPALPFKFSEGSGGNMVVLTDKYLQIECDGTTYKLAIVEEGVKTGTSA